MAIQYLGSTTGQSKTSGVVIGPSTSTTVEPGDTLFIFVTFDNLTATTPTVTGISARPAGETALGVKIASFDSPQAAAAGGVRGELWRFDPTVAGAATFSVSLSAAVTARAIVVMRFTGVGTQQFANSAVSSGTSAALFTQPAVPAGNLLLDMAGSEAPSAASPSVPSGGAWTGGAGLGTTGGSAVTNAWAQLQYLLGPASTSTTYSWSLLTDGGMILAAFAPLPEPVLSQAAYRFYADGTESGSTALAAQDTAPAVDTSGGDVPVQLRVRLQETGTGPVPVSSDFQLQYEKNASGTWANVMAALAASYETANAAQWGSAATTNEGNFQSFMGNGGKLTQADFFMYRDATVSGDVKAVLYAHTGTFGSSGVGTGAPLAESTARPKSSLVTSGGQWESFVFDGTFTLTEGVPYVIGFSWMTGSGIVFIRHDTAGTGPGNRSYFNGVSTWSPAASIDQLFRVYTAVNSVASFDSTNLTGEAATTSRLTGGTGTFAAGEIDEDGVVEDLGWSQSNYTELLYSIKLIAADLAPSDTLRFRVLRNGAVLNTYAVTPELTIGGGGPQTKQVSGTVAVTTGASGDATRVPVVHQVSGSVAVSTATSGAVTVFVPPVTHQVSGTVPVATGAVGDATKITAPQQVSGTVAVTTTASGTVSARLRVSGTVPVVVGTAGTIRAILSTAGTVPVITTVAGAATRVPLTLQVSGAVPVVTTVTGDATVVGGAQQYQVSGTVPVVTTATGAVTRVPVVHQVSGTVAVTTAASGNATRVPITHQVSGAVAVVTTAGGAATRVPLTLQVSGTVPVVTTVAGSANLVGGAQTHPVSGTVAVVTAATGSIGSQSLAVSGTAAVVTSASGNATRVPITHQVSGTVVVQTTVGGTVTAKLPTSGTVPVTVNAIGAVTSKQGVSGTVNVVTNASGSAFPPGGMQGTVVVTTGVSGSVTSKQGVSGTPVVVTTGVSGTVTAKLPTVGTVPVTVGVSGTVSQVHQVSGTVAVTTGVTGNATRVPVVQQVSGTVPVTTAVTGTATGVAGAVTHQVSGTVTVTTTASGTITSVKPVGGVVSVTTTVSGQLVAGRFQVGGRVDVRVGVTGALTSIRQISGTVVVVTGVVGELIEPFGAQWPSGEIDLYPSGPLLPLTGSGYDLTLVGSLEPPVLGTGEGYCLTNKPVRLTLEGTR